MGSFIELEGVVWDERGRGDEFGFGRIECEVFVDRLVEMF